jgi:hypothetical protein
MKICCRATKGSDFPGPLGVPILVWGTVAASSMRSAVDRVEHELNRMKYALNDVWESHRFDLDDWDYDQHPADAELRMQSERVVQENRIEFGAFIYADPSGFEATD